MKQLKCGTHALVLHMHTKYLIHIYILKYVKLSFKIVILFHNITGLTILDKIMQPLSKRYLFQKHKTELTKTKFMQLLFQAQRNTLFP